MVGRGSDFVGKVRNVVGLYLSPPQNAGVVSQRVREKVGELSRFRKKDCIGGERGQTTEIEMTKNSRIKTPKISALRCGRSER